MPQNDTLEVVVRVKPPLQSSILRALQDENPVGDTTVCFGSELQFFAKGFGGDSTNYSFQWLWNDSIISTENNMRFTPLSPFPLHLVTNDGCSPPDTTTINISILPPLEVAFTAPDTLCLGEAIALFAQATGGIESNFTYQWILNGSIIGTDDSLRFISSPLHPSPSFLQIILSDGCSSPNDTFTHEIYIRPALNVTLSAVEVCANPTTTLTANPNGGKPDNYVVQWFEANTDGQWNPIGTGLSINVTPNQFTTYRATLTDGCSADTSFAQIQIDRLPSTLTLTASPMEGCEPLEVAFEINTNYSDTFSGILFISNTDSIALSNPNGRIAIRPLASGTYTPSFQFISKLGCTAVSQFNPTITVHPKPTASFSFTPEEPDLDNNTVQFRNLSQGATSYLWNISPFGTSTDVEPQFSYTDSGFHPVQLIAISDKDCRDTSEGQVYIRTNYRVYIPNVFSPNGDGLNDVFQPAMRGFAESDFVIYNRWGERIYQSRDNIGWDGTYRGQPVPEGVYMYTLSVLNLFGEKQFFNGTVVLMR
jgi:gliding motility-associated-like protein